MKDIKYNEYYPDYRNLSHVETAENLEIRIGPSMQLSSSNKSPIFDTAIELFYKLDEQCTEET